MGRFTAREKRVAAERELTLRRSVYPKRNGGYLSAEQRREIDLMEEIMLDYRRLEERLEPDLFGEKTGQ